MCIYEKYMSQRLLRRDKDAFTPSNDQPVGCVGPTCDQERREIPDMVVVGNSCEQGIPDTTGGGRPNDEEAATLDSVACPGTRTCYNSRDSIWRDRH